jgi:hypothetical protein
MTCDEAREIIGADPDTAPPQLLEHLKECAQCRAYRDQMVVLNAKIRRALELDLPKAQPSTPPSAVSAAIASADDLPPGRSNVVALSVRRDPPAPAVPRRPRGVVAIAASLAAAVVVAGTLWLSRPPESLAAEVVAHVEGEPDSWLQTQPVTARKLEAVLRKSGVKFGTGMEPVVYASSCWFRGHFVPHFVVMTSSGPVTVMILSHEHIAAAQQFNESGYSGLLVPARAGSVAVVSRTPMALTKPADEVVNALQATKD